MVTSQAEKRKAKAAALAAKHDKKSADKTPDAKLDDKTGASASSTTDGTKGAKNDTDTKTKMDMKNTDTKRKCSENDDKADGDGENNQKKKKQKKKKTAKDTTDKDHGSSPKTTPTKEQPKEAKDDQQAKNVDVQSESEHSSKVDIVETVQACKRCDYGEWLSIAAEF